MHDLDDELQIRRMIERWAVWRDAGDWERFATVWHPDGEALMLTPFVDAGYHARLRSRSVTRRADGSIVVDLELLDFGNAAPGVALTRRVTVTMAPGDRVEQRWVFQQGDGEQALDIVLRRQ